MLILQSDSVYKKKRDLNRVCEIPNSSCQHHHQTTQVGYFVKFRYFAWNDKSSLREEMLK